MRSLPLTAITITDPFWSRYHRAQLEQGLLAQYRQIVDTGRIANLERAAKHESGGFVGYRFNDSDVYKWLEAAAYALLHGESAELRQATDAAIRAVQSAQMDNGYLNSYMQLEHPGLIWRNLNAMHEMYCAGHLIEAGVALHECLEDRRLLDVAIKFADHIAETFGPEKRHGYCGHQEIELALIKLSDSTGDEKYRNLARWMVEERGSRPSPFEQELEDKEAIALSPAAAALMQKDGQYTGEYLQDHLPIREHNEVVGHAVRAMYFYIAAANLEPPHPFHGQVSGDTRQDGSEMEEGAGGGGPASYRPALERTWNNLTGKRMYVTGGIGPSGDNEGFTTDYDLPNLTAYAETCAAVGLVFWGHSLLQLTGNSEYADVMERALYNGALAGISLDTTQFFYDNPLESRGQHKRTPWFGCACCPPNIARLIGSVGKYAISVSSPRPSGEGSGVKGEIDAFWIHIPVGLAASLNLNGVKTRISMTSNYPWSGEVQVSVEPDQPVEAELRFRIPAWADDVKTDVPGLEREAEFEGGYIVVRKRWQAGDKATFKIEMKPKWVAADPRVLDDLGRSALTYGPLVYCAEEHDLWFAPQLFSADTEAELSLPQNPRPNPDVISMSIDVPGVRESDEFPDQLYAELDAVELQEATARFIPYFAWNNRGPGNMQVWVRRA